MFDPVHSDSRLPRPFKRPVPSALFPYRFHSRPLIPFLLVMPLPGLEDFTNELNMVPDDSDVENTDGDEGVADANSASCRVDVAGLNVNEAREHAEVRRIMAQPAIDASPAVLRKVSCLRSELFHTKSRIDPTIIGIGGHSNGLYAPTG